MIKTENAVDEAKSNIPVWYQQGRGTPKTIYNFNYLSTIYNYCYLDTLTHPTALAQY